MKTEDTLGHLYDLIGFYRSKIEKGTLSGTEGQNYVRCLILAGLRDATTRSRNIEHLSEEAIAVYDLPFAARESSEYADKFT